MTLFPLLVLLLASTACFSVQHSYQGDKILTGDASIPGYRATTVRPFTAHDSQFFWIHGGFPVGEPLNGAALAAREAEGHSGVLNLRIREGEGFTDVLITHGLCVGSIFCGQW